MGVCDTRFVCVCLVLQRFLDGYKHPEVEYPILQLEFIRVLFRHIYIYPFHILQDYFFGTCPVYPPAMTKMGLSSSRLTS